jgi:ParB-like chromosome segregation protein Spo0J
LTLTLEHWPIDRLIEYGRNPRKNDDQVDRMAGVMREFGFRLPILAKSDGLVVDGHLRLKAARKLGLAEIPVVLADGLTDAQIKAFRLLANKSANWASWDEDALRLELEELQTDGFDLGLTGFSGDELADLLTLEGDGGTGDGSGTGSGAGSLAERFGVPPFSVLNAREGWWQNRKQAWIGIGIQSELGRGRAV